MLLLWNSYVPEPQTGGIQFHGTFEGIDMFEVLELPDDKNDDDEVLIAWWVNQC